MAKIALSVLVESSATLMRAGRWDDATHLLHAVEPEGAEERLILAAAEAEVAVDQDFAQRTDNAGAALEIVEEALSEVPDPVLGWDLRMLRLRKDYFVALFAGDRGPEPEPAPAPAPADNPAAKELSERAELLRRDAPDEARAGASAFYAGLIADNLRGLTPTAFDYYTEALEIGERVRDDLLASLALRHLGAHAHTAGDLKLARTQWERSTELRQKVGHLLGVLAQQTLLAVLARDEGNQAATAAIATEVNRWAHQAGIPALEAETATLMNQPTA